MTTNEIEQAVLNQFDNGRYMPLGADGGVLKYVQVSVNGMTIKASITLDHEIAQIRRIWALTIDGREQYDLTRQYYKARI